ncbi:MAG: TOMM precursor leader peptide-binding protein [Propionibacteriaceae bacterium]|jgi:bacteriocin biosynthesis cyclodehydratase domain-containing protein|nr:TOMM precursor leader peptide-binding protein [Propionibacteriaceae bacterium]
MTQALAVLSQIDRPTAGGMTAVEFVGPSDPPVPRDQELPRRPRLLIRGPAVWRRPGQLQLGLGSSRLLLSGVPANLPRAIAWLDGRHSRPQLAGVIGFGWTDWLLRALDDHDLLAEGPATTAGLRVAVWGRGALAEAVRERLAAHGHHGDSRDPELVVVAPQTAEPDRAMVAELVRSGRPHLFARQGFGQAVLGPFVLPGATSCLTCADLERRRLDPAWPLLAFQLTRLEPPEDPLLIDWLAAQTAAQAAVWQSGRLPETTATTVVLDRDEAASAWTPWPRHPLCPCRAQPLESTI